MAKVWRSVAFLAPVGLVLAAALACYLFVGIVDPYEIRHVRGGESLADHPYPAEITPRLMSVAANGDTDMVIVGASTALGYTPNMMRAAFPGTSHPANLAYACASPADFGLFLPLLERSKALKRIIISLDVSLIANCAGQERPDLDPRYYTLSWSDLVPDFNAESLELSAGVLRTGVLDLGAWRALPDDRVSWITTAPPVTTEPAYLAKLHGYVEAARGRATAGAPLPCSAVPSLQTTIVPFIRRMAARGVQVDLLAPPLSLPVYSEWTVAWTPFKAPPFASVMALQRCAVLMTAGLPNVHFNSVDTDPAIVGNLSVYRDTEHVGSVDTYRRTLPLIASGHARVAPQDWRQHEALLKHEIDTYSP